ncbi:MAG: hypothetical protein JWQ55_2670 [Rhodopila sp.]|jgi:hypothetical protein|nr:hypothetical protein [Rhodopila sp.]
MNTSSSKLVARARPAPFQRVGEHPAKAQTPATDQQLVPWGWPIAEAMVQPAAEPSINRGLRLRSA